MLIMYTYIIFKYFYSIGECNIDSDGESSCCANGYHDRFYTEPIIDKCFTREESAIDYLINDCYCQSITESKNIFNEIFRYNVHGQVYFCSDDDDDNKEYRYFIVQKKLQHDYDVYNS